MALDDASTTLGMKERFFLTLCTIVSEKVKGAIAQMLFKIDQLINSRNISLCINIFFIFVEG